MCVWCDPDSRGAAAEARLCKSLRGTASCSLGLAVGWMVMPALTVLCRWFMGRCVALVAVVQLGVCRMRECGSRSQNLCR